MPSSPSLRWSSIRILAAMAIFIAVFLLHDNGMSSSINTETETKVSPRSSSADDVTYPSLSSGVGLVTTDGAWGKKEDDIHGNDHSGSDIKILGFTDKNYLPMAKLWYGRLSVLVGVPRKLTANCSTMILLIICTFLSNCRDIRSTTSWLTMSKFFVPA